MSCSKMAMRSAGYDRTLPLPVLARLAYGWLVGDASPSCGVAAVSAPVRPESACGQIHARITALSPGGVPPVLVASRVGCVSRSGR